MAKMWNFPTFWTHFGLFYIKIPKIFTLHANFPVFFTVFLNFATETPQKQGRNKDPRIFLFRKK